MLSPPRVMMLKKEAAMIRRHTPTVMILVRMSVPTVHVGIHKLTVTRTGSNVDGIDDQE